MGTKLTRAQVAERYCVSVRTIIRWTDDEEYHDLNFPRPVRFGLRRLLYDLGELEKWEKERAAQTTAPAITNLDDLDIQLEAAE
jgi:predicted DNA-binding transcriptional regulator AlpA